MAGLKYGVAKKETKQCNIKNYIWENSECKKGAGGQEEPVQSGFKGYVQYSSSSWLAFSDPLYT